MNSGRDEGSMNDRLYFKGALIRDDAEFLCLTDMWRAAKAAEQKRPGKWLETEGARDFAAYLSETIPPADSLVRATEGRNGATWAHWQLAMAYAKYLSPEFHAWCNDVVRKVMAGESVTAPTSMDTAAIVASVIEGLAPVLTAIANAIRDFGIATASRLDAMQAQIDDIKSGGLGAIVTKAQSDFLLAECRAIAATYYTGKQAKSVKAALCSVHNRLRKELEWFGTGRTFRMLPATRYADAMVELSALRREANAAAQAVSNARQMTIMDVIERGQAEEARAKDAAAKAKTDEPGDPSDKH